MPSKDLTTEQIAALVGSTHPVTGMSYPEQGLQPYYEWLVGALHRLSEASAGDLRVWRDAEAASSVCIAPGRCSIDGQVLVFGGASLSLGIYNNTTALLWIENDGGNPVIGSGSVAMGWPAATHIRLAEVQLAAGEITSITDLRFETLLKA